jgi:NAD(P)H-dependent flavin oxidoreductase YrpB (nitropropane dioxygenase family)
MALPPIFDNLRLPVIGSPLFIVSGPELVIAQCKAGVVGSFPALNARPASQLDEWLHQITEELAAHNRDNPDRPAACSQPDCPQIKQPPAGRYCDLRQMAGADHHYFTGRTGRIEQGCARLGRYRPA